MFEVQLKNEKIFSCDSETNILAAAEQAGLILEHSCLNARCRSCKVKVLEGEVVNEQEEFVLSHDEIKDGFVLSCNAKPISNIKLDIEDLGDVKFHKSTVLPAKIDVIETIGADILRLILRLPPSSKFKFLPGQYVNIIKGDIKRSYSIANIPREDNKIEFYIRKYDKGLMSEYFFSKAKVNDLLRLEGPLGTFFYRKNESIKDIIFLATGTGIAPVKAILEEFNEHPEYINDKNIWLFWGGRYQKDIFFNPEINLKNFIFTPVLSRENKEWQGEKGYVQDVLLRQDIDFENAVVYACGSNNMILSAKKLLIKNNLKEHNFYSDAFVSSN
ncbi:FAD-binding oxidoreductase [Yeosuana marina]|uniref:FAD-binding oxidoreductase n=1 Tax=Yeosuana marina TaxID=1565536 RepID=UPI0030EE748E|tara:strand:+ start:3767 stop:4756 length:990 start_codon:yes stop_codon:yes gene_type:complete